MDRINNIVIPNEWLSQDTASFKILVVVSVLADNKLAFRGKLNDLCEEIGIQNSSLNRSNIRKTLLNLSNNGIVKLLVDGDIYTVSLAKAIEKSKDIKQIKKAWYTLIRETKSENNWVNLLKTFLYICDIKHDQIITYREIGVQLGLSASTIGKCVRTLKKIKFPDDGFYLVIRTDHDTHIDKGSTICNGTSYTIGMSFE